MGCGGSTSAKSALESSTNSIPPSTVSDKPAPQPELQPERNPIDQDFAHTSEVYPEGTEEVDGQGPTPPSWIIISRGKETVVDGAIGVILKYNGVKPGVPYDLDHLDLRSRVRGGFFDRLAAYLTSAEDEFTVINTTNTPLQLCVSSDPNHMLVAKAALRVQGGPAGGELALSGERVFAKESPVQIKSLGEMDFTTMGIVGKKAYLTITTLRPADGPPVFLKKDQLVSSLDKICISEKHIRNHLGHV